MNANIKVIPFPGIENAYVVISGHKAPTGNGCRKCMSFFYGTEKGGCEWEPDNGPITRIYSCSKDHEEAKPHWFYPFYTGAQNWSQCAVDDEGLAEKFLSGHYDEVFAVLKSWAEN